MIDEVIYEDDRPVFVRFYAVAVSAYGDEGCTPTHREECPLDGNVACVSRSGDSICGGYYGHAGPHVVKCREQRDPNV
jgi:hypothetical protein